jgi:hypothetical protein
MPATHRSATNWASQTEATQFIRSDLPLNRVHYLF